MGGILPIYFDDPSETFVPRPSNSGRSNRRQSGAKGIFNNLGSSASRLGAAAKAKSSLTIKDFSIRIKFTNFLSF